MALRGIAVCGAFALLNHCVAMAQDKAALQVTQFQCPDYEAHCPDYSRSFRLDFDALPPDQASHWFVGPGAPGTALTNYSIYQVIRPNTSTMQVCDVSHDYLDAAKPLSNCGLPIDATPTASGSREPFSVDSFGKTVTIPLLKPLHADASYIITLRGANGESLDTSFSNSPSIITDDVARARTQLKVTSKINLKVVKGQAVTVTRAVAKAVPPVPETYPAIVTQIDRDGIVLSLQKKLPNGKSSPLQLQVTGLTDNYGTPVTTKGKITSVPGPPADISTAFVTTQLSAIAAVHSAPTFSGTGALAPWHPAVRMIALPAGIFLDPAVTFDVGSANAKSSNAVTIPSQFSRAFLFGLPSNAQLSPADLIKENGVHPIGVNVTFGPRAEFDTQYGGVNMMAEGRGELYLPRLSKSGDARKAVIAEGNPAIRDLLELPGDGYSIAPYLQFDAGGHLNSQKITNQSNPPALIPTYAISRLYMGLHGSGQLGRNSINFDGSWVDLFKDETVPVTVKGVVSTRSLGGFQPHAKGTYNFYLDETKHYAATVSWENGRTAPIFQYLNKVTAGIKITY